MKTTRVGGHVFAVALMFSLIFSAAAAPLGTAFTYQGRLTTGGQAANGSYDFRFVIYDALSGVTAVSSPLQIDGVGVTNGSFAVVLDFGQDAFSGAARWLEVSVRTNQSLENFQSMTPRQPLTPAPYALWASGAGTAAVANNVANNAISAAAIAPGQVVRSLNGLKDDVQLTAGQNVTLATNGTTLQISAANPGGGTTLVGYKENGPFSAPPVALGNNAIAQGEHAQALGNNSVVGGGLDNTANHLFTTIGGGWTNAAAGLFFGRTTVGGGEGNQALGDWSTVGGGQLNIAGGPFFGRATVAGGWENQALGDMSVIAGGSQNQAVIGHAVIGGGQYNLVTNGAWSVIGGGQSNRAFGIGSIVAGGARNDAAGPNTTISGGSDNQASEQYGTIGGGHAHRAFGISATIAGGFSNTASGVDSTVAGGSFNETYYLNGTVGGGHGNQSLAVSATVAGGADNVAAGQDSVISGGFDNQAVGLRSTVPGGYLNEALGDYSLAAGMNAKANHPGAFVWADSQGAEFPSGRADEFAVRATGGMRVVGPRGIALNADDAPLITRGWDAFDSSAGARKEGHGRWGLFMEPYNLVAGIPGDDVPGRNFQVAKYAPDGSRVNLMTVTQSGNVGIGVSPSVKLQVAGTTRTGILQITGGSDVAEPFKVSGGQPVPKGAVLIIDEDNPGQLRLSTEAYDRRVAGIASGAGGLLPGLTLSQEGLTDQGVAVALTGRVYTLAEAWNGPIRPGDLLTTSGTPGHAMRVTDHAKAQGAIIGKAMSPLNEGSGLVLVLVSLQ